LAIGSELNEYVLTISKPGKEEHACFVFGTRTGIYDATLIARQRLPLPDSPCDRLEVRSIHGRKLTPSAFRLPSRSIQYSGILLWVYVYCVESHLL
jgi:hypothetical protein